MCVAFTTSLSFSSSPSRLSASVVAGDTTAISRPYRYSIYPCNVYTCVLAIYPIGGISLLRNT